MNDQPHTPQPVSQRKFPQTGVGAWQVIYGTTAVELAHETDDPARWPAEKRERVITATIAKAVQEHDEASRAAGAVQAIAARAHRHLQAGDGYGDGRWGTDLLQAEPVKQ